MALYFAKFSPTELWLRLFQGETHPPGFYLLLRLCQKIVGFDYGAISLSSIRALWRVNVFAFIAGVGGLIYFARTQRLSRGATLFLIWGYSFSQFHVGIAAQLRPYAWLSVWLIVAFAAAMRAYRTHSNRDLAVWASAGLAALYFHYFAIFPLAIQFSVLFRNWGADRRKLAVALGTVSLLALPSLLILANPIKLRYHHPLEHTLKLLPDHLPTVFAQGLLPMAEGSSPLAVALAMILFVSLLVRARLFRGEFLMLVATIILPLAGLLALGFFGKPGYLPRYYIFVHLSLLLISGIIVDRVGTTSSRNWLAAGGVFCGLILIDGGSFLRKQIPIDVTGLLGRLEGNLSSQSWRGLTNSVRSHELRTALCDGRAVTSDDYAAAELLLYHCPEKFASLSGLSSQIFVPSKEWRNLDEPPRVLIYLDDVPSHRLFESAESFFRRSSVLPADEYDRMQHAGFTIWIRRS